ncbi:MAG: hypothetical protein HKN19_15810, partial [Halioglobus sp.]|nr:hypothetical protein [Halioglobus sp.]
TAIHALANGVQVDGLILLDPLLVTNEGLTRAVWAVSGIPPWLVSLAGWAAHTWHGFPAPGAQALDLAADLTLPVLAIQDPGDPVTPAKPLVALASRRDNIELWLAPEIAADDPRLADKGRWGSHVAAFGLFPRQTMAQVTGFIARTTPTD